MIKLEDKGYLRKAAVDDAKTLATWWATGEIMAHAGFPQGIKTDIAQLEDRLRHQENNCLWIIEDENHCPIGEMNHTIKGSRATLGIKICVLKKQGQGIGKIALKSLIKHLFDTYSINEIWLDTMIENTHAQHVYTTLFFEKLRVNKNVWRDQLGHLRTSVEFILTKENYQKYY